MKSIEVAELVRILDAQEEWALFDIRETAEADAGHIMGATFLPRRMIELKIADLVPNKSTTIVVYDEGGPRADLAAETLARLGYLNTAVLRGGLGAWREAQQPITQGSNVPSKLFGEEVHERHSVPKIPPAELKQWQEQGKPHVVCDIRTPEEYQAARIPGAWGCFGTDVARAAADLKRESVPVVVNCAGRTRSIIACQSLRDLGVAEVYALEDGTMGWQLAGYELERGEGKGLWPVSAQSREQAERTSRELAMTEGVQFVSSTTLREWLAQRAAGEINLYVFDVRQTDEYRIGHVAGAAALPGGLAIQRTDEFAPIRHARIVFIDDLEARAALTARWFRQMGFSNAHVLEGGLAEWKKAGGAIETGKARAKPLGFDAARAEVAAISARNLTEEIAAAVPPLVVDVDTSKYFAGAHVPGAQWVPYGWLEARIAGVAPDKAAPIVTCCHNGVHSLYAAANLQRLGYSNVRVLSGGVDEWRKAGLALAQGAPDAEPAADLVILPYAADQKAMARYLEWEKKLTHEKGKTRAHSGSTGS